MRRKIWELPGGIHPPENKKQSLLAGIKPAGIPSRLVFPLSQHIGAPAKPVVKPGDHVLKGQLIAEAAGFVSSPIHASTSGIVADIAKHPIPHPSGLPAPCIIIDSDGKDEWIELQPIENYKECEKDVLIKRIHHAGIAGMGGAGFPSHVKLSPSPQNKIDTLIINGTECEPYITADDMLMRHRAKEIIRGIKIIAYLLDKPANIILGIEDNKPEAIEIMRKAADGTPIEIVTFPTKYPSGGEKQLIWILTGKEVPTGGLPAHIGIVVQNVGTAEAVYRAVYEGKPLLSRLTTVTGEAVSEPANYEVLLGTPLQYLLEASGFSDDKCSRIVIGGPMMGYTVEDLQVPVVKTTNCILVPSQKELPANEPANPCIRCGMCAQACPVSLLPQQLYWHAQAEDDEKLLAHNLMDCIECGCCSFVCPSNIPLVQYYRAAKSNIRQSAQDKLKSDKARQRFEARKLRIEKEAEEKAARQKARQEAAAAKKNTSQETKPANDPVQAAVEKARQSANQLPPESQLEKLQKNLDSARQRLERAVEKVEKARLDNSPQLEQLQARAADMQVNLQKAEEKLAQFQASQNQSDSIINDSIEKAISIRSEKSDKSRIEAALEKLEKKLSLLQQQKSSIDAQSVNTAELDKNIELIEAKIRETRSALDELDSMGNKSLNQDAATLAIEKAKAKLAAQQTMSPEEKLKNQIASLEERLSKARQRLEKAREENAENIEAFEAGVNKLAEKLAQCQQDLQ